MYLGGFLAVGFVSCNKSMARLFCWMNEYRQGIDVFMEAMFHVTILASKFE